jgi:hypothetical protein
MQYEVGPIRPPSESSCLLVRVSRNCPWNRCTFCPVYKCERFSLRSADDVVADIEVMANIAERVRGISREMGCEGEITSAVIRRLLWEPDGSAALQVATFLAQGGTSAFLQDADSLVMPPEDLVAVITTLKKRFPSIIRVTSYARSRTLERRSKEQLASLHEAGLTRIHVGIESGNDEVLRLAQKGVTAAEHIVAGIKTKAAGFELSCYVMPGLGGRALSEQHADDTAHVLREIDPHFVRLRTLAVAEGTPLGDAVDKGEFEPLDDLEVLTEIRQMIAGFEGMTGEVHSDHVLNLLGDLAGKLPDEHRAMLGTLDTFLGLDEETQKLYIIGRRLGMVNRLIDLYDSGVRQRVTQARKQLETAFDGDMEGAVHQLMNRLV